MIVLHGKLASHVFAVSIHNGRGNVWFLCISFVWVGDEWVLACSCMYLHEVFPNRELIDMNVFLHRFNVHGFRKLSCLCAFMNTPFFYCKRVVSRSRQRLWLAYGLTGAFLFVQSEYSWISFPFLVFWFGLPAVC